MKKTITIIVLSFVFGSNLFSQQNHGVANIQWEVLDGPTGYVTGFAKSGNRLFAKPHFYSDDMGESWYKLPDFFEPDHFAATDKTVLVHERVVDRYFISVGTGEERTEHIYRSDDNGKTFQKSIEFYTGKGYRHDGTLTDFVIKNENTFCFAHYDNGPSLLGTLYHTSDGGINWGDITFRMKGQIYAAHDTVIVVGVNDWNDPSNKVPIHIFGNDDFSNPKIDTLPKDSISYYLKELYQFSISKIDEPVYFSNNEGLFSYIGNDPTIVDTLYISPSPGPNYSTIPFGIFDDIWLIFDNGDVQRSLDNGTTWERKSKGITNVYGTMELIDDRFSLNNRIYSSPTVDFWSSDNPPTGTPQGDGNVSGQIFTYGDTLVKFEGQTRLESIDNGITWDSLHFSRFTFGRIMESRDTFVVYNSRMFWSSYDKGKNWTLQPYYFQSYYFVNHLEDPVFHGMYKDLLIMNNGGGVLISRDYGASWSWTNTPFGRTIGYIGTGSNGDVFIPGAKQYFYKDNYIYAFQDGYGLWRTPYDELERALRGIIDASDLELTMTTKDLEPGNWTNFAVEVNIENTGTLPNDNIIVHVPKPDEVVFEGRNEYQSTQGHFEFWQIQEWEVGSLEPGESATLTLNYFRKNEKPFDCYTQVISAAEPDLDSSPDNGSCCTISEDDEAVLEFGEAPPNIWGRSSNAQNFGEQSFTTINFNEIESKEISTIAFPNPFNNELNFKIKSESQADGQIQIYDVLGRLILQKPIQLLIGENLETIETTNLPTGILTAKISNSKSEFQRVQVLKQ